MSLMMWRAAAAAATLAVLATAAPAIAGKRDNMLKFASAIVPESIDAYFNNVREGVLLAHHVWDHLVTRNPRTGEYQPSLAKSWRWVDDRTLELQLREGIRFHNGEAFDADDVVYTLNFVARPENKVVTQTNVSWIDRAEKVAPFTVRLMTKEPFPAALEYLAGPVVIYPNEYYAAVGPKGMSDKPVGTGPYRVTEHQAGRFIRMERNKDYFKESPREQPTIEKLEFRLIPDLNTQVAELMAGQLDWIWRVPPDQAAQLKRMPGLAVVGGETMRIAFLNMNTTDKSPLPAMRDIRVRRAINHAIDREAIVRNLVGEGARVVNSACFPAQFGCTEEGLATYPYDPAKAKALLAEAGFPNGFDVDILAYRERSQTEAMIGYLRAVGIRANLRFLQYAALRDLSRENKSAIEHQTWGSFSVNDSSASVSNYFKFTEDDIHRDPQVRDWLNVADGSISDAVRKENYRKALQRIAEQAYWVPLYSLSTNYAIARDLEFTAYADEIPRFWESKWK